MCIIEVWTWRWRRWLRNRARDDSVRAERINPLSKGLKLFEKAHYFSVAGISGPGRPGCYVKDRDIAEDYINAVLAHGEVSKFDRLAILGRSAGHHAAVLWARDGCHLLAGVRSATHLS